MSHRSQIEIEREADGRWIAEILNLPGVMVYGKTKPGAFRSVRAPALRVLARTPTNQVLVAQALLPVRVLRSPLSRWNLCLRLQNRTAKSGCAA